MDADRNDSADPWAAAVLLHPHPDMGGDRFNPVVDTLFRRLPEAGVSTIRFDFSSSDVVAAAAQVVEAIALVDIRPLVLAGYSFGADVATTVDDERIAGWFLVAPPLRIVAEDAMTAAADGRPKGIAVPERDQFCPPDRTRTVTAGWANTALTVIPGSDHFLASPGATAEVAEKAVVWMRTTVASG